MFPLPAAAVPADLPRDVRLQIVSPGTEPPDGDGWLHEIKHDGHRLIAIVGADGLKLLSRNGRDRTALFREPFRYLPRACRLRCWTARSPRPMTGASRISTR